MNLLNLLSNTFDVHAMAIVVIAIFVLMIVNFGGLYAYWILQYNKTGSSKFSFTRYLPFELNRYRRDSKTGNLDFAWILLSIVLLIAPIIVFAIVQNTTTAYILAAFFIAQAITFAFLLFVKLSNYKGHIVTLSIFIGLEIGIGLLSFWFFTSTKYNYISNVKLGYVNMAIIMLQLIFQFVLILNPTYKNWAKMQKMDCGTFNRPKYCYIAMLEWGTFLNMILNYVVILLVSFF